MIEPPPVTSRSTPATSLSDCRVLLEIFRPRADQFSAIPTWPEVAIISIGDQRPLTARASFSPSIEPGIWISVKTTVMSRRASRNSDGFVGVGCFEHLEPGGGNHINRLHSQQKFVLDDQHHGSFGLNKTHATHSLNRR